MNYPLLKTKTMLNDKELLGFSLTSVSTIGFKFQIFSKLKSYLGSIITQEENR